MDHVRANLIDLSLQEIWEVITDALEDETELKRKALRAFIHARQHFTPARQVGYILELTELYRSGERGYEVSKARL